MSIILVRGLSEETLSNLKDRAKRNNGSLAAEVREILERDGKSRLTREEFLKIMDGIRERSGPQTSDSVDLFVRTVIAEPIPNRRKCHRKVAC